MKQSSACTVQYMQGAVRLHVQGTGASAGEGGLLGQLFGTAGKARTVRDFRQMT